MKQVAKLGVLFALIACSMHTARSASLKSSKINKKGELAQCNVGSGKGLDLGGELRNQLPLELL